jgi:hypothetical protein
LYICEVFAEGGGIRSMHAVLETYGYGHNPITYDDTTEGLKRRNAKEKDCDPYKSQLGGEFFKVGIWGRDDRRPRDINESELPEHLRLNLTPKEKKQLKGAAAIWCVLNGRDNDGTGFIVDIEKLGASKNRNYEIIASAAHVLFDDKTGEPRKCEFVTSPKKPEYLSEAYSITPLKCGAKDPGNHGGGRNGLDWCFAKIEKKISDRYGSLEIDFTDKFDYTDKDKKGKEYFSLGWRPKNQRIEISTNCSPDDKRKYPNVVNAKEWWGIDFSKFISVDCDVEGGASGGPFIERNVDRLKVLGLAAGDYSTGKTQGEYAPNDSYGTLYTKFTSEMEKDLKKIILQNDSI